MSYDYPDCESCYHNGLPEGLRNACAECVGGHTGRPSQWENAIPWQQLQQAQDELRDGRDQLSELGFVGKPIASLICDHDFDRQQAYLSLNEQLQQAQAERDELKRQVEFYKTTAREYDEDLEHIAEALGIEEDEPLAKHVESIVADLEAERDSLTHTMISWQTHFDNCWKAAHRWARIIKRQRDTANAHVGHLIGIIKKHVCGECDHERFQCETCYIRKAKATPADSYARWQGMQRVCEAAPAVLTSLCAMVNREESCKSICGSQWETCVYVKLKQALAELKARGV